MQIRVNSDDQLTRAHAALDRAYHAERDRAGLMVEIGPFVPPATRPQLKRLFASVNDLADQAGVDAKWLRRWLEDNVGPQIPGPDGAGAGKSFGQYSKAEASAMIERVRELASERGYNLP